MSEEEGRKKKKKNLMDQNSKGGGIERITHVEFCNLILPLFIPFHAFTYSSLATISS